MDGAIGSDQVGGKFDDGHCSTCRLKKKKKRKDILCKECQRLRFEERSKMDTEQFDMLGLDVCHVHIKPFEFMCGKHQNLCCSSCFFDLHRSCKDVIDLQAYAASEKSETTQKKVTSMITDIQVYANSMVTAIKESQSHMTSQVDSLKETLDDMKKTVMKKFDDFNDEMVKHATEIQDQKNVELDQKLCEALDIGNELEKVRQLFLSVSEKGSELQKVTVLHTIPERIASLWPVLKDQHTNLSNAEFSLKYKDAIIDLLKPDETIGTLRIATESVCASSQPPEKNVRLKTVASAVVKQKTKYTKHPKYPNCSGMDFLPDGRLVVVENANGFLAVMNERLTTVGLHKLTNHRYDVVTVSDEEVAVTGSYVIEMFRIEQNHRITLTRTLSTQSQYFSISLMNETTFLVSTFKDHRPLRMVTLAGEETDFNLLPSKVYQFNKSRSVFNRAENKCLLTDADENGVHFYDLFGSSVVDSLVKNVQINKPMGVCVGPSGTVFVCSSRSNSIVQLTSSGRILCSIKLPMKYPSAICISKDMARIAITSSCEGESKIQIYELLNS